MAQVIDSLKVMLGIDVTGAKAGGAQFNRVVKGIEGQLGNLKGMIAGYFTFDVAKELVRGGVEYANRIKDISEQTGIGVEEVKKFDKAFKRVGLGAEDAASALAMLTEKRKQALEDQGEGGERARNLFAGFGISEQDLKGATDMSDLAKQIAASVKDISNDKTREAFQELFGTKKGGKLLAGFAELKKLGPIVLMDKEQIDNLDLASKKLDEIKEKLKISAGKIAAPIIEGVSDTMKQRDIESRISELASSGKLNPEQQKEAESMMDELGMTTRKEKFGEVFKSIFGFGTKEKLVGRQLPSDVLAEMEKRVAILGGVKDTTKEPDQPSPEKITDAKQPWSIDVSKSQKRIQERWFEMQMGVASQAQKRSLIEQQISELAGQAKELESKGKFSEATAAKEKMLGLASGLLPEQQRNEPLKMSSMSQVGGFIGGEAGNLDAYLVVQKDMIQTLRDVIDSNNHLANLFGNFSKNTDGVKP